ncbi:hypothetical protein [Galactobacter valiniphilus]|uniref:hypothetical protein n=1 Tax=Galactobacter valiniphilus TaxID=2676122 RepID=UPI0037357038
MAKRDLSAMLKSQAEAPANSADAAQTSELPESRTSEVSKIASSDVKAEPRYTSFLPKTARLRADQITALGELTLQVQAARQRKDERITDNTLLRLAVDLLLEKHRNELNGSNEDELRTSLGLTR